jgi:hypothetical protein
MSSKRQQTFAKLTRERMVKERRERKQAKRREKRLPPAERDQGDGASADATADATADDSGA